MSVISAMIFSLILLYPLIEIDNVPNFFFLVLQHYIVNLMHGCLKKKNTERKRKEKKNKRNKGKIRSTYMCIFMNRSITWFIYAYKSYIAREVTMTLAPSNMTPQQSTSNALIISCFSACRRKMI